MEDLTSQVNDTSQITSFEFPIMEQELTVAQECFRKSIVIVGLCLNLIVLLVVSSSRQLRYPRHIFWAVISFFECVFLIKCALEVAVIAYHNQLACQILVILAPVDYSVLLLILSLAALDRYLAIVRYEWYKKRVTNCNVIAVIFVVSTLSIFVITIPFWTGYQSIYTCTNNLTHMKCILMWDLLLGIAGVVLHFKIFMESKILIQHYVPNYRQESITVRFVNSTARQPGINSISGDTSQLAERGFAPCPENPFVSVLENSSRYVPQNFQLPSAIENLDTDCFPWKQSRLNINRLELRAAFNMSVNILPFWLCTFPVSCSVMALYWCIRFKGNCDYILLPWPYMWNLFLLHSIYNPIMYMCTSSEFWRALLHTINKLTGVLRN